MQHIKQKIFLFIKIILILSLLKGSKIYADPLYFLCGSDEDGCFDQYETSCICIPINLQLEHKPYCLNFDKMKCQPLTEQPDCDGALIFANQGACIATIFQSEAYPPCQVATRSFCVLHSIKMGDEDGSFQDLK